MTTLSLVRNLTTAFLSRLKTFEFSMLSCEEHQKEFEDLFSKGLYDIDDALYKAWLHLKRDANGTEEEAFRSCLEERTPRDIPKSIRKRRRVEPEGPDKYDPLSQAWTDIYISRGQGEETDDSNKKNVSLNKPTPAKRGRRPGGGRKPATSRSSSEAPTSFSSFPNLLSVIASSETEPQVN